MPPVLALPDGGYGGARRRLRQTPFATDAATASAARGPRDDRSSRGDVGVGCNYTLRLTCVGHTISVSE